MEKYYLITFKNTISAIKSENEFKENNIEYTIMPTPTFITQSCGISIRIKEEYLDKLKKIITNNTIDYKDVYVKNNMEYEKIVF